MIKLYRISAIKNDKIIKIFSKLFSENYGVYDTTGTKIIHSTAQWERVHSRDGAIVAVGIENPNYEYSDVLGYCTFRQYSKHSTAITSLCVKKQYRRNKVATHMIDNLVSFMSPGDLLSVATKNPAVLDIIALRPDMELLQSIPEETVDDLYNMYGHSFNKTFTQLFASLPIRQEIDCLEMEEKLNFWNLALGKFEVPENEWIIICRKRD